MAPSKLSSPKSRGRHARAILGPKLHDRLPNMKVLIVGAGGIGCELLKNAVLTGFGHITLLDLDTIDLSNLNRQFLFRKKDVKQSKALVAARTASAFNPNVHITPIHGNIKESQFDLEWFRRFDIVLNALDNLDARRHVNKMCMAGNIPLVESGTAGYLGQVQPLLKDRTECFDCVPKPTPKTFPVCTIRSTPTQPIHCIVWAKSYLMPQLFGIDEDSTDELDEAETQGENAQEIANLRREAQAFKSVRAALRSEESRFSAARAVFQKVFYNDILNLLSMEDMWRFRDRPVPLDFDLIQSNQFVLRRQAVSAVDLSADVVLRPANGDCSITAHLNGNAASNDGRGATSTPKGSAPKSGQGLKDQRSLSLQENLVLFVSSSERLAARLKSGNEETISFDKDDGDALDFVTAAANLRSTAYGIPGKSRWEVKGATDSVSVLALARSWTRTSLEMAGNIIPAIATTNAIISGLIVLQALHLLRAAFGSLRNIHAQFKPSAPLSAIKLSLPNPHCGICRDAYAVFHCDPSRVTLSEVLKNILNGSDREVSTYEDKRMLSDPEFDDNLDRTLESLDVTKGKFLSIADEDGELETITLAICALPPNHPVDGPAMILPSPLPNPAKRVKPILPETSPQSSTPQRAQKRPVPDGVDESQPTKRARIATILPNHSPSKARRLEEDGLVLLDQPGRMDEDIDIVVVD
ncbi:hypothetical protein F5148DRAFT_1012509 [Russula earlei]|uniref:Uncharacterized protein n=1 Tax=Russula earlei TaxID=71964 RepID=A0ACC0UC79_9AGAM|nr:hypothetical protein F5148DRAFT_1012509 [Russula earlei]